MTERASPGNLTFTATAPSNIAFVKYWGKRDEKLQWPANDSLSMTLSECRTTTSARKISGASDIFHFQGETLVSSAYSDHKVFHHLQRIKSALRVDHALEICSSNLFPTACGIASSASGFAALTLAVTAALTGETGWEQLSILGMTPKRLADIARMGSGSAGRSIHGGYVLWRAGISPESQDILQIAPANHWDLSDIVVIFSPDSKHTPSSKAHKAAWGSPLFPARITGIDQRMQNVLTAIEKRDIEKLGYELEHDALEMHAVSMTGSPSINYFSGETAKFIAWVRSMRASGALSTWFTIDAGPNVHLICETENVPAIKKKLSMDWPDSRLIIDRVGTGPTIKRDHWAHEAKEDLHV